MSAVNTVLIQKLMSQQKDKTLIDQTKLVDTANLALAIFKEKVKSYIPSAHHSKIDEEMNLAQEQARSAVYQYNTSLPFTSSLPAPVGPPGSQFVIEDIDEVAPPKSKRAKKDKTDIKNRGVTYTAHNHFVASYMPIVKAATVMVDGSEKKQFDNHAAMAELGRLWRIIQPDTKMQFHLEAKGIKIHHADVKPGTINTLGTIASDKDVNKALNSRYANLDLDQKRAYYIRGNMLEVSAEFDLVSQHLHTDYASLKCSIEVVPQADPPPTTGDMPVVQGTTMVQGTVSSS